LRAKGGRILAISTDVQDAARGLVQELALSFAVLSDAERVAIRAYGLVHDGGGPGGETIAVPAELLVRSDGTIVWRHVATRITDRPDPAMTRAAVEAL
jgi:peroxiredoxin